MRLHLVDGTFELFRAHFSKRPGHSTPEGAEAKATAGIWFNYEREFGFEITTFVRTPAELASIVAANPFGVTTGDTYFVTFLKSRPTAAQSTPLRVALDRDSVDLQRMTELEFNGQSVEFVPATYMQFGDLFRGGRYLSRLFGAACRL